MRVFPILAVGAMAACASQASPTTASTPAVPTFLEAALNQVPDGFEGVVEEVIPAGGYTYVLIDDGDEIPSWVVTLRSEWNAGDDVVVRPYGQLEDFTSKITGRTFETLLFASLSRGSA